MSTLRESGLLAVDVGNSLIKFGWFPPGVVCTSEGTASEFPIAPPQLLMPEETLEISHRGDSWQDLEVEVGRWIDTFSGKQIHCFVASVHDAAARTLMGLLSQRLNKEPHLLCAAELPIEAQVDEPDKVGIDRLLCAVAANQLRDRERPAVVISLGTACTVNLIGSDGAFAGGAILPGIAMSAQALHQGTSALPLLSTKSIEAPIDAVGRTTEAAISSGLVWGMVGAVKEVISRMSESLEQEPQLFVTGGDAEQVFANLGGLDGPARHVPNMVLTGIHIAAGELL